jgi:hypothetical protein
MRFSNYALVMLIAATQLAGPTVSAQQVAATAVQPDCLSEEPDSLQISWTQPCDDGNWLLDTRAGCRMWDWHPDPKDRAVWSGACPRGKKEGRGVVQWTEHGIAVDRFEGTFRDGKREGFGRYVWTPEASFEGQYANDVPNGSGTATLLGESFSGTWKNGCFSKGNKVVAIGVERSSCAGSGVAAQAQQSQIQRRGKPAF